MMKRIKIISLITLFICTLGVQTYAQTSNDLIKEERSVANFHSVVFGETAIVYFTTGETTKVIVETTANKIKDIRTEVQDGILTIKNMSLRSPSALNIYITAPSLKSIDGSGASEFYTKSAITADELSVQSSGAAKIEMEVNVPKLTIKLHGASEIYLKGETQSMESIVNGSSILDTKELAAKNVDISAYSKAVADINASKNLHIKQQGNSQVNYTGNPEAVTKDRISAPGRTYRGDAEHWDDYEYSSRNGRKFGSLNINIGEHNDSTYIRFGRHEFIVDEYGNARYRKHYWNRFNGHWGGVDVGINAYVTPDFDMDFGNRYDFLDLNLGASSRFDLNVFEQNISLSKNNHWGFVTGLGMEFRNYRFDNNITLNPDKDRIDAYKNFDVDLKKNKLTAYYLNIPCLFEYQTNSWGDRRSFHVSAGMVFGLKVASKTKMVFNSKDAEYTMVDYEFLDDPAYEPIAKTTPDDKRRVKNHNSFHLNPIKVDAMLRFGWGWFNFYTTYSLTTMFKKGEGPEDFKLYPISFGITLIKW